MRLHKPVHPSQQPHLQGLFQGGIPSGDGQASPNSIATSSGSYDDGGPVANTGQEADQGSYATVTPTKPGMWSDEDEARLQATNNTMENTILSRGLNMNERAIANAIRPANASEKRYDEGGVVNPNAFLGWPNEGPPAANLGFDDGGAVTDWKQGQVDPTQFVDPTSTSNTQALVDHATQFYDDYHKQLEAAWNAEQGGQQQQSQPQSGSDNDADDQGQGYDDGGSVGDSDADDQGGVPDNDADNQSYAQGGGIPVPPGPAGPGVKPQPATGNAGRPGFTNPDPGAASAEKNYTQNVSSRPATSPSRGTSFSQPPPRGGQRGQEWYGKGASPYGKGRKTKNG